MPRFPAPRLLAVLLPLCLLACSGDRGASSAAPAGVALAPAVSGTLSLLAGAPGGSGYRDGSAQDVRFDLPLGAAVAADGTAYVADHYNHVIRRISPAGEVTTLAGKAGEAGSADGAAGEARFRTPGGLALAADGTVYVADTGNFTLRRISPEGEVSTLAGLAGGPGAVDGTGGAARFRGFYGVTLAADGALYIADSDNRTIRRVTTDGMVSTLAGSAGVTGSVDATGAAARFDWPAGITSNGGDVLYVADAGGNTVRKVTLDGVVSTLAGSAGQAGSADGSGAAARFSYPFGIAVAGDGSLLVADTLNHLLRRITNAGEVSTVAGLALESGAVDGAGGAARFNSPAGLASEPGGSVLVMDAYNHVLRRVSDAGEVSTPFGRAPRPGSSDAVGADARFDLPAGAAVAADGTLYVADTRNHVIRAIDAAGAVTTLAGLAGVSGSVNGPAADARFDSPTAVAVDGDGVVYVADSGNHVVRKITPAGVVSVFAGVPGAAGSVNGSAGVARFSSPSGIALDGLGNVYVADTGNHLVRRITSAGVVSTLAGSAGVQGAADGAGSAASFASPQGVGVSLEGLVHVADRGNHLLRVITPAGVVSTLAGSAQQSGAVDGSGSGARFNAPYGVTVDADGNAYVADRGNHLLRRVSAAGEVVTLAGVPGMGGVVTGALPAGLNQPLGIAIGIAGELYTTAENAVLKVELAQPAATFGVGLRASESTLVVGQSLSLSWFSRDATACVASGDWSGERAPQGSQNVTPPAVGSYSYTLACDEDGGAASRQSTVTVTVVPPAPLLSLGASAAYVAPGNPLTLTWSAQHVATCVASGDWSGAQALAGSQTLTPALGARSYTLTCTGAGGSVAKTVLVSVAPPPVITLVASRTTLTLGGSLTLDWSVAEATACSASGGWSGPRATSGTVSVTPAAVGLVNYVLTCSGSGGSVSTHVPVTVKAAATAAAAGGGGAVGLEVLLALGLLLPWVRRSRLR